MLRQQTSWQPVPVGPSISTLHTCYGSKRQTTCARRSQHQYVTHMLRQQTSWQPVPVGPSISMLLLSSFSSNDVESRMSLAWRDGSSLPVRVRCSTALLGPSGLLPLGVCSVVIPAMCSSSRHNNVHTSHHSVRTFSDSTAVRSHWSRPHNKYSLQYLYWNRLRLNFFSKNKINRVLELELQYTNNDCRMF